jgi:hypothetical protein
MTMPNFLIIGAMKSGTTALYYYLEQHPQVYMSPVKEPNFFAFEGEDLGARWPGDQKGINGSSITEIEAYRALYAQAKDEKALGEASHWYLYRPKAVERIKHHIPDAKMIVILRNPVERAYSHFLHSVRTGTELLTDFTEALQEEASGARKAAYREDYFDRGLYAGQVQRYFDVFGRDQVRVYLHEDLNSSPHETMKDIFQFLQVDDSFIPDVSLKRNVSGFPKNKTLDRYLRGPHPVKRVLKRYLPFPLRRRLLVASDALNTRNLTEPPKLQPEVRRQLTGAYREDILNLQELINRNLFAWVRGDQPPLVEKLASPQGSVESSRPARPNN